MTFKLSIFTFLVISALFLCSCNSGNEKKVKKNNDSIITKESIKEEVNKVDTTIIDSVEKQIKKKVTKKVFRYICPQGDAEGNSNKEGVCSACGMELIENPDYNN